MQTYALYLESGPRRQKATVLVLDLLGCIAKGPTTGAAQADTPSVIRLYDDQTKLRTKVSKIIFKWTKATPFTSSRITGLSASSTSSSSSMIASTR